MIKAYFKPASLLILAFSLLIVCVIKCHTDDKASTQTIASPSSKSLESNG